ncbi:MAG TPA: hypothetical protein VFR23_04635 [Jiangellaceae bacterium]|nr:hypothetical protein [Jiangellaceae bacterium]
MRCCPFCDIELGEGLGPDDEGVVEAVLRCPSCEREFGDPGQPWNPVEIRQRVAAALEQERRGGL